MSKKSNLQKMRDKALSNKKPKVEAPIRLGSLDESKYEDFKSVLPRFVRERFTRDAYAKIMDATSGDEEQQRLVCENIMTYTNVLQDGKYSMDQYIDAIKFVTHRMLGKSIVDSYKATFPDRVKRLREGAESKGIDPNDTSKMNGVIRLYADQYNKTKLVVSLMSQTVVPLWILNQGYLQEALNVEVDLMRNASSEKVRHEAAAKLLDALAPPEASKVQVDVAIKDKNNIIDKIREETQKLAKQQRLAIESGSSTAKDIASSKLEIIDVEED